MNSNDATLLLVQVREIAVELKKLNQNLEKLIQVQQQNHKNDK